MMYTPSIEQTDCASGYFIRARNSRFGLALQNGCVLAMCTWSAEVRRLRQLICHDSTSASALGLH